MTGQTQHGRLTIQVRTGCVEAIVIPETPGLEINYADYLGKQFSILLRDEIFKTSSVEAFHESFKKHSTFS